MAGITGEASGLVTHVFRLVRQHEPKWLVLENVRNMLALDGGRAMEFLVDELESLGYSWAYRLVDSRFTGVPQRRQRVLLVASKTDDPREVLLSQDAGEPRPERFRHDAFGFYWTEGLRGLGWAIDAVPTLKGGSTIGIPSPPGVWIPDAELGRRLLVPTVGDGEVMQGFPRNWTRAAETQGKKSARWKLVGNAVTVGVAEWLGRRLLEPLPYDDAESVRLEPGTRWPTAAWGIDGSRWKSHASMWPERRRARHLLDVLSVAEAPALSLRGASGFLDRTQRSTLRFSEDFILDVKRHVEHLRGS
jgi:DNA (cytosine-5)-methyltransferase 1